MKIACILGTVDGNTFVELATFVEPELKDRNKRMQLTSKSETLLKIAWIIYIDGIKSNIEKTMYLQQHMPYRRRLNIINVLFLERNAKNGPSANVKYSIT